MISNFIFSKSNSSCAPAKKKAKPSASMYRRRGLFAFRALPARIAPVSHRRSAASRAGSHASLFQRSCRPPRTSHPPQGMGRGNIAAARPSFQRTGARPPYFQKRSDSIPRGIPAYLSHFPTAAAHPRAPSQIHGARYPLFEAPSAQLHSIFRTRRTSGSPAACAMRAAASKPNPRLCAR